jgi:halocyanin-like protein
MSGPNVDPSRRTFLKAAAGTASVSAATGTAAAAETTASGGGSGAPSGNPDFGGYLDGANGYDGPSSAQNARGQNEVTIEVGAGGNLAYAPAAVWVDVGTTVRWEWVNGNHNVIGDDNDLDSGNPVSETGVNYEYTFEESGIYNYYCTPHQGQGMLGGIAVGNDIPTVEPDTGGGTGPVLPENAKILGLASGFAMTSTLGLAYIFMKYGGDYEGDLDPDA